jgi:hypothetical protein
VVKDTHVADFYRRSAAAAGASQFDAPDPATTGWVTLAAGVRCSWSPATGDVRTTVHGRETSIAGTLFVHPARLPAGVDLRPDDGVAIVSGRAVAPGRFIIAEARPIGGGSFDDELDLESVTEAFA